MKAKILTTGYVDENFKPQNWEFDCMDVVPMIEVVAGGQILYAGYTIQELENISLSGLT